jgi:hypothetical protein
MPAPGASAREERSFLQTLRGIRLGSLIHGKPEAIPLRKGNPYFPRCHTSHGPQGKASAVWLCDIRFTRTSLYALTRNMWGLRTQIFSVPSAYQRMFVLEPPQLKLMLAEVRTRLKGEVEHASTLMEIESVMGAAIRDGQPALILKWMKPPFP